LAGNQLAGNQLAGNQLAGNQLASSQFNIGHHCGLIFPMQSETWASDSALLPYMGQK
jgi:hypothetical protein